MKKLLKIFLFGIILNFIIGLSFIACISYVFLVPSLEGTNITLDDFFKKELDPEKYEKLEHNISVISKHLGKESAKKLYKSLEKLFPSPDFDYSEIPAAEYPFPSIDEVLQMNEDNVQRGFEQGLKNLQIQEQESKEGIELGLKYLEESEKLNQVIKENTLSNFND